mmetsp:Transcript_31097/g.73811  ORF Transcript_31097/g.73811 Transcript_31097/m.73811 type:complete len:252 (-) Transcript_31097:75-830(-)
MGCAASTPAPDTRDPSASPGKAVKAASTPAKGKDKGKANGGILPAKKGAKGKYQMGPLFAQFDADGDGKLDIYEISRAFRAMGLPKRDGEKMEMDHALFKSFDTNGDGVISMEELDKGLKPKTRRKIEDLLEGGWIFDKAAWDASVARHNKYNLADIFKGFDRGGEGKIPMADFYRAFRAMGLPKRDGEKVEMDKKMFDSFDSNGDGFVTLVEFQENILPKTRKKIEMKLEEGWKFDQIKWDESGERHKAA